MRKPILVLALALTVTWPAIAEQAKIPKTAVKLVTAKAVTKPEKAPETMGRPANELFGSVTTPAPLAARSIGSYAKGCLAGGVALPINGPDWQVMRLSRNRNWGNPRLLDFLERFAARCTCTRRLAGPSCRRHVAAAGRTNDHRSFESSDRSRCRHLADADARPNPDAPGAGRHDGRVDAERSIYSRSRQVDAAAYEADQARGIIPRGRSNLRTPSYQKGAV